MHNVNFKNYHSVNVCGGAKYWLRKCVDIVDIFVYVQKMGFDHQRIS